MARTWCESSVCKVVCLTMLGNRESALNKCRQWIAVIWQEATVDGQRRCALAEEATALADVLTQETKARAMQVDQQQVL